MQMLDSKGGSANFNPGQQQAAPQQAQQQYNAPQGQQPQQQAPQQQAAPAMSGGDFDDDIPF